jgi:hypothetical protein
MKAGQGYRIAENLFGSFEIPGGIIYHVSPPGFQGEVLLDCTDAEWEQICRNSEQRNPGIVEMNARAIGAIPHKAYMISTHVIQIEDRCYDIASDESFLVRSDAGADDPFEEVDDNSWSAARGAWETISKRLGLIE